MNITLENTFHNTKVTIRVPVKKGGEEFYISRATQRRMTKALCPHGGHDCKCGPMNKASGRFDYDVIGKDYKRRLFARLVEKY